MKPSRILTASAAALVLLSVAGPAAAGPPAPTDPPVTNPDTTTPDTTTPDTTAPPESTAPPETPAPETTLPSDPTLRETTELVPEAAAPKPHKPTPIASPDTGIAPRPGTPRVLMIGNSIMGQVGPELQAFMSNLNPGVPVARESVGQSSLYSKNQYRLGKTHVKAGDPGSGSTFNWLLRAQQLVNSFNPSITVVEFGYNYKAPFPKDGNGVVIQPGTSAFVRMAKQQAKALTNILRSRGGQVLFVSPLPLLHNDDKQIMNGSWSGFMQAQQQKHFGILFAGDALDGAGGAYTASMTWCTGGTRPVRDSDGLHLHPDNGVELMGEALMRGLANLYALNKPANTKFC